MPYRPLPTVTEDAAELEHQLAERAHLSASAVFIWS